MIGGRNGDGMASTNNAWQGSHHTTPKY
jgi:hypothetical protein